MIAQGRCSMTKIYEGKHYILIRTGYSDPEVHRHMAAHVIVALDGEMKVTSGNDTMFCRGVMIPAGVYHRVDTRGKAALIFLFDCTSNISAQITQISPITEEMYGKITAWYSGLAEETISGEDSVSEKGLWDCFGTDDCYCTVTDERILLAMDYIRSMCAGKVSCQDVADYIHLSQDRFSHLFKQQTGMTFSAYVIYQRIMGVYSTVFRGKSITEASLQSGFFSSSHLADVNHRIFGLTMRSVMDKALFFKLS